MCFSAEASFIAGSLLSLGGLSGIVRVVRKKALRLLPYALIPMIFALHQFTEGGLWIALKAHHQEWVETLSWIFVLIAYCLWPLLVPISITIMEPQKIRKKILIGFSVVGVIASLSFLYSILSYDKPISGYIHHRNIEYTFRYSPIYLLNMLYGASVNLSGLASSFRSVQAFAAGLTGSYVIAYQIWRRTYESVWCYFGAVLSMIVLIHIWNASKEKTA